MNETNTSPAPTLTTEDPKTAAAAIASGGRLSVVSPGRRLRFVIEGLPASWLGDLVGNRLQVDPYVMMGALERLLDLIRASQDQRRERGP
jgi:hypothetical protein